MYHQCPTCNRTVIIQCCNDGERNCAGKQCAHCCPNGEIRLREEARIAAIEAQTGINLVASAPGPIKYVPIVRSAKE